jgi:1,2-phenylacetyl-CoA epoxidase catalytic subunit
LEEDIALANIALDFIGQARLWLELAGELEGKGRSAVKPLQAVKVDKENLEQIIADGWIEDEKYTRVVKGIAKERDLDFKRIETIYNEDFIR